MVPSDFFLIPRLENDLKKIKPKFDEPIQNVRYPKVLPKIVLKTGKGSGVLALYLM